MQFKGVVVANRDTLDENADLDNRARSR